MNGGVHMVLLTERYPEYGIRYQVNRPVNEDGTKASHAKVRFNNASDVARAVENGYIEVDGVRLDFSEEAKKKLEESRERVQKANDDLAVLEAGQMNAESAKKQGEAMAKETENMGKAIEIFRRMSKGGIVPSNDEKLLMEFDDKMYQTAKAMQAMAERHKKHKRLSEDEEEDDEGVENKMGTNPRQTTEIDVEIEGESAEVTDVSEVEKSME